MLTSNSAGTFHDFALFESHEREHGEKPKRRTRRNAAPQSVSKSGSSIKILLAAVCAVILPICILSSKLQSSELSVLIGDMQMELDQAERENLRLQAELDSIVTLAMVEDFAENVLGMRRSTTTQGVHISLDTGGTTVITEDSDNPVAFITIWFSEALEYLGFR
ncbi:MAG: hypothetical protein LBC82_05045 [Oscillospiraceae bacterium]|jgi:cell division protein FtsL|nr:hypothetical protein [Oscillospiraceae bacterium]